MRSDFAIRMLQTLETSAQIVHEAVHSLVDCCLQLHPAAAETLQNISYEATKKDDDMFSPRGGIFFNTGTFVSTVPPPLMWSPQAGKHPGARGAAFNGQTPQVGCQQPGQQPLIPNRNLAPPMDTEHGTPGPNKHREHASICEGPMVHVPTTAMSTPALWSPSAPSQPLPQCSTASRHHIITPPEPRSARRVSYSGHLSHGNSHQPPMLQQSVPQPAARVQQLPNYEQRQNHVPSWRHTAGRLPTAADGNRSWDVDDFAQKPPQHDDVQEQSRPQFSNHFKTRTAQQQPQQQSTDTALGYSLTAPSHLPLQQWQPEEPIRHPHASRSLPMHRHAPPAVALLPVAHKQSGLPVGQQPGNLHRETQQEADLGAAGARQMTFESQISASALLTSQPSLVQLPIMGQVVPGSRKAAAAAVIPLNVVRPPAQLSSLLEFQDLHQVDFQQLVFGRQIGEGGFGKVFVGRWQDNDVAIKLVSQSIPLVNSVLLEFHREVTTMMSLPSHRNVLPLLAACTRPPSLALVTPYCTRGSLYSMLHDQSLHLSWRNIIHIALGAARGMSHLHAFRILHRDLKSGNLLVCNDWTVKVADFGLSRVAADLNPMTGGLGTYQWMSPEVMSHQPYSYANDVYSFGIVLWETASRALPFAGLNGMQAAMAVTNHGLRPPIPEGTPSPLASLMKACWAPTAGSRPTFPQVVDALSTMQQEVGGITAA